jgi:hypothetical protein
MRSLLMSMLLVTAASNAEVVTVDFESFTNAEYGVVSNGFYFDNGFVSLGGTSEGGFIWQPGETTTMTQVGGASFDLLSLDYTRVGSLAPYQVVGHIDGGGSVSASFSGVGEVFEWNLFNFDSSWINLTSVDIIGTPLDFYGIDNVVVVSAVPLPAAVWLFGSALAGLGWMRRRKTT